MKGDLAFVEQVLVIGTIRIEPDRSPMTKREIQMQSVVGGNAFFSKSASSRINAGIPDRRHPAADPPLPCALLLGMALARPTLAARQQAARSAIRMSTA